MLGLRIALFLGFVALGAYMTTAHDAAMQKCLEKHTLDVCTYSIR